MATLRLWILRRQQASGSCSIPGLPALAPTSWPCQKLCRREYCGTARCAEQQCYCVCCLCVLSPHAKMRPTVCLPVCVCVCINETQFQLFTLFMWKSCQQTEERQRDRRKGSSIQTLYPVRNAGTWKSIQLAGGGGGCVKKYMLGMFVVCQQQQSGSQKHLIVRHCSWTEIFICYTHCSHCPTRNVNKTPEKLNYIYKVHK